MTPRTSRCRRNFASRKVEKIYHAIVCGEPPRDKGEIRADIARHPTHRKRMAVSEHGREAEQLSKFWND